MCQHCWLRFRATIEKDINGKVAYRQEIICPQQRRWCVWTLVGASLDVTGVNVQPPMADKYEEQGIEVNYSFLSIGKTRCTKVLRTAAAHNTGDQKWARLSRNRLKISQLMILSEQWDMKQHTQSTVGHTDNVCMIDTENPLPPAAPPQLSVLSRQWPTAWCHGPRSMPADPRKQESDWP